MEKKKKNILVESELDKWEREEQKRLARERDIFMTPQAMAIRKQRQKQAEVLWEMYKRGELVKQTLEIPMSGGGVYRREFLFSHKSIYAV